MKIYAGDSSLKHDNFVIPRDTYRVTFAVGYVTLRPSLTRSIRKLQHISRKKDVVHFNKQQCKTRDYVLNDLLNN